MLMTTNCQIEAVRYIYTPEKSLPLTMLFGTRINHKNSVTT